MPFNGSGTFQTYTPGTPFITGTVISSTVANAVNTDVSTGLSTCVTRDGQSPWTANIPAGGFKITGLGAGTAAGNSLRYEQVNGLVTTAGDLLYGSAAGTLSRLAGGTGGQILQMNSGATAPVWGGGVVQRVYAESTTYSTLTTTIPYDDTIPQITEGTELLTASITPKSATNRIRIRFQAWGTLSNGQNSIAALFVDATANALDAMVLRGVAGGDPKLWFIEYEESAGSTSARTYRIRLGPGAAASLYINGDSSSRLMGGVARSTLIVEEVA